MAHIAQNSIEGEIEREEAARYRAWWEEAPAREVSLVKELYDAG